MEHSNASESNHASVKALVRHGRGTRKIGLVVVMRIASLGVWLWYESTALSVLRPVSVSEGALSSTQTPWAALCSAMKDEELYVDDWVDYHLALGFDHIFIYDTHPNHTLASWHADRVVKEVKQEKHNAQEKHSPMLTLTARRVHVIHYAKRMEPGFQEDVNNACLDHLRSLEHPPKWVMVMDADEYLVLRDMDRYPSVTTFLTEHVTSGALQINWNTMGSGHELSYRAEPVTRRFQWALAYENWNIYTKAVAVLDHVERGNVHDVTTRKPYQSKGMGGRPAYPSVVNNGDTSVVAIFHYKYKSLEEFNHRQCVRGDIMHDRFPSCPRFVEVGDTWDGAAWNATQRLVRPHHHHHPPVDTVDDTSTVVSTPVPEEDPPVWAALCTVVGEDRQYKEAYEDTPPHTTTARRVAALINSGEPESLLAHCHAQLGQLPTPPTYIMALSIDQFLVIRDLDRYPNVVSFLADHVPSGSLQISRIVMGSANETTYQDVPVTGRFQYAVRGSHHSETRPVAVWDHIQAIQTFFAVPKPGYHSTGMGGRAVAESECCITDGDVSAAAIYHYLYRSVEEIQLRCKHLQLYTQRY